MKKVWKTSRSQVPMKRKLPAGMLMVTLIFSLLVQIGLKGQEYMVGADLSFLRMAEEHGFVFRKNGQPKKGLEIFKNHSYN